MEGDVILPVLNCLLVDASLETASGYVDKFQSGVYKGRHVFLVAVVVQLSVSVMLGYLIWLLCLICLCM